MHSSIPAIANAIYDAVGIRLDELGERVVEEEAVDAAGRADAQALEREAAALEEQRAEVEAPEPVDVAQDGQVVATDQRRDGLLVGVDPAHRAPQR